MDQNYQNYHDTGEVPNSFSSENLYNKTLNIGIIIGGVMFSTGFLICLLCGYGLKRRNQKVLKERSFLRTLSLPTYEKAVYDDCSKIETPPPTYQDLFFWTILIRNQAHKNRNKS